MARGRTTILALCLACLVAWREARPQSEDPNLAHPMQVVTVQRDGYTISGLATHLHGAAALKYAIALFPGFPGILRLREEDGKPVFGMRGNFLVRSRRHWLDSDTLVLVVDAPSDEWASFSQQFRETARYGADIAALLDETGRRFQVQDWTLVGTSEGSVSVFHAARMNLQRLRRAILTASVFRPSGNGPGLSTARLQELPAQALWVHHEDDPCFYTPYRDAREFAQKSGKPLLTVRGGPTGRGEACQAFTAHGFVGVERETVLAMRSWVKSGIVPPTVGSTQ